MSGRKGDKPLTRRMGGRTFLTTAGAARMLGVSEAFVLRVAGREIGPDGVGLYPAGPQLTCWLFRREEVRRFAEGEPMPYLKERRRHAGMSFEERRREFEEMRAEMLKPDHHPGRKFAALLKQNDREERAARQDAEVYRWRKRKVERGLRRADG